VVAFQRILADPESHEATPEVEQIMRQALGHLDAKAGDAELEYLEVLRRVQGSVERELFRWASSLIQPAGFSGEIQIPVGGGEWELWSLTVSVLSLASGISVGRGHLRRQPRGSLGLTSPGTRMVPLSVSGDKGGSICRRGPRRCPMPSRP
jgi:hypothetical protein